MMLVEPVFRSKWGAVLLAGTACAVCFAAIAVAAVVSPDPIATDAGYLVVPVSLLAQEDDDVSGVLFELTYDPTAYELADVFTGASAEDAGKDVHFAAQGVDSVRVLVTGFNQERIASGQVALVYLKPLGAKQANAAFDIQNTKLSDPFGQPIAEPSDNPSLEQSPSGDGADAVSDALTADEEDVSISDILDALTADTANDGAGPQPPFGGPALPPDGVPGAPAQRFAGRGEALARPEAPHVPRPTGGSYAPRNTSGLLPVKSTAEDAPSQAEATAKPPTRLALNLPGRTLPATVSGETEAARVTTAITTPPGRGGLLVIAAIALTLLFCVLSLRALLVSRGFAGRWQR